MSDIVLLEVDGGVATVTLNRPDTGNAIDVAMARGLMEAARRCDDDPEIRAVVLTGAGERFCVGGDVKSFAVQGDDLPAYVLEITGYLHAALSHFARMDAPVVAAVHGAAAGAGMSLVCAADLAVAEAETRFVMGYTAIGLTPDGSSTYYLSRLVGLRRAQQLLLLNRPLDALQALEWGLVSSVFDGVDNVRARATDMARRFAAGPTKAYGGVKRLLLASTGTELEAQLELEGATIAEASTTADARAGIAAFLAKEQPEFHGE